MIIVYRHPKLSDDPIFTLASDGEGGLVATPNVDAQFSTDQMPHYNSVVAAVTQDMNWAKAVGSLAEAVRKVISSLNTRPTAGVSREFILGGE